ncbi:MAG: 2,4-dihydroxyhept-2-ene-1,7-dioic acid aldolase [Anaerolineae bacterium]|nr:2,4-dihydroxyhept-2-ene-1,7-dioic acid aldolase [Anaerolineae bacterium]
MSFRTRLKKKELLYGTILTLASPEVAEILADAGYDFLFIDMEHTPISLLDVQRVIQATQNRCACLIRIPSIEEGFIKKALDCGPAGIIAPLVKTAQDVELFIQLCKYPPEGQRSFGLGRAQGYGLHFQEYISQANKHIALIVLIEHIHAVNNIDKIIHVDGFDAVLLGPYDLSGSMGKPGKINDPDVQSAIHKVESACANANIPLGVFGIGDDTVLPYLKNGYTLITVGADSIYLGTAAAQTLKRLKAAA